MKKWITVCHIIVTNTSVKDKRQKIKVKFHSFSTFCSMQFTREGIWKHSWSTAEREGEQEGEREWGFKLFLFKLFHLSSQSCTLRQRAKTLNAAEWTCDRPVASLRSWKNFWLKIKATPLISSTFASAVVFLLMKLAVMAMASLPRNSLRRNPEEAEILLRTAIRAYRIIVETSIQQLFRENKYSDHKTRSTYKLNLF